ncbi:MAG: RNA polymerase sigma-70 factor [Verrucomicrobia bacterium]|nr:RNA polymerase sigma-70 factor [Prolixibacteraceae bacterium]
MKIEDKILIGEIKNRNKKVFEQLFYEYYPHLVRYAEGFLFDKQACHDIVQNLFIHFWEKTQQIEIHLSLKSYFYQSVKNRSLNHLRNLQVQDKHHILYVEALLNEDNSSGWVDPEILKKVQDAIVLLPPQMGELFKQKYLFGRKVQEIAELNQISENTVKTQLKRAKDKLRIALINQRNAHKNSDL